MCDGARLADSRLGRLRCCVAEGLERIEAGRDVVQALRQHGWDCIEWQYFKNRIARVLADCLSRLLGCRVWLADLHGGEYLVGLGNKDVDLLVECPGVRLEEVEQVLEEEVASYLSRLLGGDPHAVLGVPNIVELHDAREGWARRIVHGRFYRPKKLC